MRSQRYANLTAAEMDRIGRVPFQWGPLEPTGAERLPQQRHFESHRGLIHRSPEARLCLQTA